MAKPARYRKKPIVIEAMEYQPQHINDAWEWASAANVYGPVENDASAYIFTLEGRMECKPGDFIIKGVNGEFYPCKPDIFAKTYEMSN